MESQAARIADGVFQFHVPMPTDSNRPESRLRYTLVYLLETQEGWVMLDTGWNTDESFDALKQQLSQTGVSPHDVTLIAMTHGHNDHFGLAARTKELTGARIALHKLDATNPYVLAFDPGVPPPAIDVFLEGGQELVPGSGLWTIWTPGHTPGHICVHDRKRRLLFTGDHMLPRTTPNVSFYPGMEGNPLKEFMEGHLALKALDVQAVHPAHEYSFTDLAQRVDDIIRHHEQRANEILSAVGSGPRRVGDITSSIHWNVGTWEQMDAQARVAALWETTAHLHYLVEEGRLSRQENGAQALLEEFRKALGTQEHRMAMIGAGRLGGATLTNPELGPAGYKIFNAFDADPRQVGQQLGGLVVEPMEHLEAALSASGISTAIVSIPPRFIQGVVDRLVASNVKTIVNYTAMTPRVPSHVTLHNIDALQALQSTTYQQT